MKTFFEIDNLPMNYGYIFDTITLRQKAKKLPKEDREQIEKKLQSYENTMLKMAFQYCVLAKHEDCGHWELFQYPKWYGEEDIKELFCKGKCTRCTLLG